MCSSLSGVGGEATLEGEKEPPDLPSWEYVSRSVEGVGCGTVAPPVGQFLALQLESEITVGGTTTRQVEGVSERLLDVRAVISFDANDNVEDVDLVCFGRRRLCHFFALAVMRLVLSLWRGDTDLGRPVPRGHPRTPGVTGTDLGTFDRDRGKSEAHGPPESSYPLLPPLAAPPLIAPPYVHPR